MIIVVFIESINHISGELVVENIIDTFINGLKNMFKNPSLFVPLLVFSLLSFALSFVLGLVIAEPYVATMLENESNWILLGVVLLLSVLIFLILSSYISAGTIGMSKEAVSTGKTKLKDMFAYGNKYAIRFVFATIVMLILELVMIIFWLPTIYLFVNSEYTLSTLFDNLLNNPDSVMPFLYSLLIPVLIGFLLTLVYYVVISILFYFVTYAIVADDLSVLASFKKSYTMMRQHPGKILVFLFVLFIISCILTFILYFISWVVSFVMIMFMIPLMISDPASPLLLIVYLIQVIMSVLYYSIMAILSVAITVWGTRFYMAMNDHELYEK